MEDRTNAKPDLPGAPRWAVLRETLVQRKATVCAWTGLMVLVVGLRWVGIGETSIWHDEAHSIHVAGMSPSNLIIEMSVADNQPPLYFLLLKVWGAVSWSPLWLRLLSVVLSVLTAVYAVKWMRLWSRRAGWLAGLLVATHPLLVHYGQEIRAYALMFWLVVVGLYCGERLGRGFARGARAGLLISATLLPYVHYVGFLAAGMLWMHAWLRGTSLRRTAILSGAWAFLSLPMFMLGFSHTSEKTNEGYWIPRLSLEQAAGYALAETGLTSGPFGQHGSLQLWESSYTAPAYSWVALILETALLLASVTAAMIALAAGHRSMRKAAWMLVATSATYAGALAMFSWLVVPIALERTAFAAFLPLLGVLALAGQSPGRRRWAIVGTTAGVVIAAIWATTAVLSAAAPVERRPNENALYAELARRVTPADVLVIFPPELQASAGYFLRDKVSSDQIHTTEAVRLKDVNGRIRLLPEPRTPDTAWLDRVRLAAARFRSADLRRHGVWVVDMGIRSAGDKQRDRLVNWLLRGYEPAETIVVGDRWMFTAQHYVLKSSVPTTTSRPTGWD